MRTLAKVVLVAGCLFGVPAAALAQASIAGVVKDTSGALLPGVTVEASSPVLIEKTRSVTKGLNGKSASRLHAESRWADNRSTNHAERHRPQHAGGRQLGVRRRAEFRRRSGSRRRLRGRRRIVWPGRRPHGFYSARRGKHVQR